MRSGARARRRLLRSSAYGSGHLALALGDVSGKGTAAALLSALAIGILRAQTVDHAASAPEVLAALNNYIHGARLDARFVVMHFGVLDQRTRRLTLANAGNPYPLMLRKARVDEVTVSGIPLGLIAGAQYDSVSLDLQRGDVIVLASDGILECRNEEQEAFGRRRLAKVLTSLPQETLAENICSAILGATNEFSGHASAPDDDRALLVLRVSDDPRTDFSTLPLFY